MNQVSLYDKFLGCIAGAHIGSAMGAAVENMSHGEITRAYGTLDKFLPYEHYNNGWMRTPGTTEDGIERQKLMITAIIEKQGRINSEDLRRAWIAHMNPHAAGWVSEPFEGNLLRMALTDIAAKDIGKYCDYACLVSFGRSCHPIGLINAGNTQAAKDDVLEVGQVYQTANSRGLQWACVTGVAIAEATKPGATMDQVIGAVYDQCHPDLVLKELDRALSETARITDYDALRAYFDGVYSGTGVPYSFSFANEVVTKGVVLFRFVGGNTRDAVIAGVNMGRDTDCCTAVAAGISGALTGWRSLPNEWFRQLDYATKINPHTNSQRTLRQSADGLYAAYLQYMRNISAYAAKMIHL